MAGLLTSLHCHKTLKSILKSLGGVLELVRSSWCSLLVFVKEDEILKLLCLGKRPLIQNHHLVRKLSEVSSLLLVLYMFRSLLLCCVVLLVPFGADERVKSFKGLLFQI